MSSSLVADLKLISGKEITSLKSVELKTFTTSKTPQIIRIENMSNSGTESTKKDIWEFCLNNKTMFENATYLHFDKRIHEHVAIKYFYHMLDENEIRFGMSNHEYASFTLAACALSTRPTSEPNPPDFHEWMTTHKK